MKLHLRRVSARRSWLAGALAALLWCVSSLAAPEADAAGAAARAPTVLTFAAIVDGTGEPVAGREIVVEHGVIVAIGLTVSGAILWSIVTLLSKTQGLALSLSGIAGIIVSVGVTVDSYVVFFERLKDEVRSGKTLRNSAQRGFAGAWRTIVIADLVSLIGAFVLWYLTVGAVRGFAFFLGLSTACDLVVSYFFTRPMVLLLARTQWMERRKVMGIEVTAAGGAS